MNTNLPANDMFICTADHKKELPVEVTNTILSAMPLDYPSKGLHVYLSDDACSALTLLALREAFAFASSSRPFCRMFGIKTRCTKVYFSNLNDDHDFTRSVEYERERENIKSKYELFKEHIRIAEEEKSSATDEMNPSVLEVNEKSDDDEVRANQVEMPLPVYVSHEKRPTHLHHFKAGVLNCLVFICSSCFISPFP